MVRTFDGRGGNTLFSPDICPHFLNIFSDRENIPGRKMANLNIRSTALKRMKCGAKKQTLTPQWRKKITRTILYFMAEKKNIPERQSIGCGDRVPGRRSGRRQAPTMGVLSWPEIGQIRDPQNSLKAGRMHRWWLARCGLGCTEELPSHEHAQKMREIGSDFKKIWVWERKIGYFLVGFWGMTHKNSNPRIRFEEREGEERGRNDWKKRSLRHKLRGYNEDGWETLCYNLPSDLRKKPAKIAWLGCQPLVRLSPGTQLSFVKVRLRLFFPAVSGSKIKKKTTMTLYFGNVDSVVIFKNVDYWTLPKSIKHLME